MITSLRVPRRCLRSFDKIVRAATYTVTPEHTSSRLSDYSLVKEHDKTYVVPRLGRRNDIRRLPAVNGCHGGNPSDL
jgi:hypothetical protein